MSAWHFYIQRPFTSQFVNLYPVESLTVWIYTRHDIHSGPFPLSASLVLLFFSYVLYNFFKNISLFLSFFQEMNERKEKFIYCLEMFGEEKKEEEEGTNPRGILRFASLGLVVRTEKHTVILSELNTGQEITVFRWREKERKKRERQS